MTKSTELKYTGHDVDLISITFGVCPWIDIKGALWWIFSVHKIGSEIFPFTLTICYGLNVCALTLIPMLTSNPSVMVLGEGVVGKYLGHEGVSHEWDWCPRRKRPEN